MLVVVNSAAVYPIDLRLPSQFIGPSRKANAEHMENKHAPKETKLIVRIPAGRSAFLLSHPISPPRKAAMIMRLPNPHSSGVRYKSALALVLLQIR